MVDGAFQREGRTGLGGRLYIPGRPEVDGFQGYARAGREIRRPRGVWSSEGISWEEVEGVASHTSEVVEGKAHPRQPLAQTLTLACRRVRAWAWPAYKGVGNLGVDFLMPCVRLAGGCCSLGEHPLLAGDMCCLC